MDMELKYFRLIKTIAEAGSLANSSEKLFLTQSALSHQLKGLEDQLGFKVFHRSRNSWKLTEEGTELYALANSLLTTIERGFSTIQQIRNSSQGTIRLSTECYSFYQGIPAFIQKMAVLYPDITIDLILDATHRPVSKVLSNELDIAIVTSDPATEALSCIRIFEDEVFAVMHCENPLNAQDYLRAGDFSNAHLIIHSYPLETVSVYEHFLKPHQVVPGKISAIPFTELSLEIVTANMGIMCLPRWALNAFRLPEELVFKKIGRNGLKRSHYFVVRKADEKKRYITDFMQSFMEDFIRKEM